MQISEDLKILIRKCFPFDPEDPRSETQLEIVEKIMGAFLDGTTDVILQGPTGSGKSGVIITVYRVLAALNMIRSGFITTPQKTLQNQYACDSALNDYFTVVKGRSAYRCAKSGQKHNHICSSLSKKPRAKLRAACKDAGICEYYTAIEAAQNHPLVLHNFASLIYQSLPFGHYFEPRDFLAVDECHRAEDALLGIFSFSVTTKICTKYGATMLRWPERNTPPQIETIKRWLNDLVAHLQWFARTNEDLLDEKEEKKIDRLIQTAHWYLDDPDKWVCNCENVDKYEFKPIDVSRYGHYIYGKGNRFRLWASATILGEKNFARSIGLADYFYCEMPSTFLKQNQPIYVLENTGIKSLNKAHIEESMPLVVKAIDEIMESYPNEKGIIHTHTYKILEYILKHSRFSSRLMAHGDKDREEVLGDFLRSEDPVVLVSPSSTEGIDLKDDQGRFGIIVKLPWAYLGDPQIRALKDTRPGWYVWKCSLDVVQGSGRINRHQKDKGDFYVIDPDFRRWRSQARPILPQHFLERIVFIKD